MKLDLFRPIHVVALVVIIGCFILLALGVNSVVAYVLLSVVAFFFGTYKRTPPNGEHGQGDSTRRST